MELAMTNGLEFKLMKENLTPSRYRYSCLLSLGRFV